MDPVTKKMLKDTSAISAVGLEMGLSVVIGYFAGRWLDKVFGTSPILMYVFLFFGLGAAGMAVYRVYVKAKSLGNQQDDGGEGGLSGQ